MQRLISDILTCEIEQEVLFYFSSLFCCSFAKKFELRYELKSESIMVVDCGQSCWASALVLCLDTHLVNVRKGI